MVAAVGVWSEQVVPRVTHLALGRPPVTRHRRRVLARASGVVLDLGSGSAPNLPLMPPAVAKVLAVEPSTTARRLAEPRLASSGVSLEYAGLSGDGLRLELPDDAVDTVVSTFTLCTVPDLDAALTEARRVLRPTGRLLFLEHVRSPDDAVARWQRRLTGVQQRVFDGCHLDRDTVAAIERAGMSVQECDTVRIPGPSVLNHVVLGSAA